MTIVKKTYHFFADIVPLVLILLFARGALADHYVVPSGSMEPTVRISDRVWVDKRAYGLRVPGTHLYALRYGTPQPGDVVVLDSPADERVLLKRVVAGEGTLVSVRDGKVSLDGAEPAVVAETEWLGGRAHRVAFEPDGGPDFGPVRVPEGKSLVMGDNRGASFDGRSFGFVDNDAILGRADGIYFSEGRLTWRSLD